MAFHAFGQVGCEDGFIATSDGVAEILAEPNVAASVTIEIAKGLVDVPANRLSIFKVVNVEKSLVSDNVAFCAHDSCFASSVAGHCFHAERSCDVARELHVDNLVIHNGVVVFEYTFSVLALAQGLKDALVCAI